MNPRKTERNFKKVLKSRPGKVKKLFLKKLSNTTNKIAITCIKENRRMKRLWFISKTSSKLDSQ